LQRKACRALALRNEGGTRWDGWDRFAIGNNRQRRRTSRARSFASDNWQIIAGFQAALRYQPANPT
jgi:hypothetical protein